MLVIFDEVWISEGNCQAIYEKPPRSSSGLMKGEIPSLWHQGRKGVRSEGVGGAGLATPTCTIGSVVSFDLGNSKNDDNNKGKVPDEETKTKTKICKMIKLKTKIIHL